MNGALIITLLCLAAFVTILIVNHYFIPPANRYPNVVGYTKIWKNLSPAQQRQFKKRFSVKVDEYQYRVVIMVRPLHRLYALLNEGVNNKDSFYKDRSETARGVRYYTNTSALKAVEKNKDGWFLLRARRDIEAIMDLLPGAHYAEKMINFVTLFEFDLYGHYDVADKERKQRVMYRSEVCLVVDTDNNCAYNMQYDLFTDGSKQASIDYLAATGLQDNVAIPTLVSKKSII